MTWFLYLTASSRTKSSLIAGLVAGVCIFLLILALMFWYRLFRKTAERGTDLIWTLIVDTHKFGPVNNLNFSYRR